MAVSPFHVYWLQTWEINKAWRRKVCWHFVSRAVVKHHLSIEDLQHCKQENQVGQASGTQETHASETHSSILINRVENIVLLDVRLKLVRHYLAWTRWRTITYCRF